MKTNFVPHYDYFTNNKDIVVAVVHYAKKPVRGVAKCDPRDTFDLETGKAIAKARCDMKVAAMRKRVAKEDMNHYKEIYSIFLDKKDRATDRYFKAEADFEKAKEALADALA